MAVVTHHPGTLGSYCLRALQLAQGVKLLPFLERHRASPSSLPNSLPERAEDSPQRTKWKAALLDSSRRQGHPGSTLCQARAGAVHPDGVRPDSAPHRPQVSFSDPSPLWSPGPPLWPCHMGTSPRGQECRPRSDLCTSQRATSPKPLNGATKLLAPAGTIDQRPPAHPQKAMPPGSLVLFPTGCPVSPAVCDGAHMRCSEEHLSAPLSSFHPRSALKVLLSTHPGSLCPLWPILSLLTLAPPVPRQAMPGPVATLTPPSSQPKAALLAGTAAAPTNPGLPHPEPMGVLPAYHHPVHTCPCQISDATGSPQKHRFRVTPAWPS